MAVLGLAPLGWAPVARAFCREVTVEPPPNYEPAEAGCFTRDPDGGQPLPTLFWRNQCVSYSLQQDASPKYVSLEDARAVAFQAFQRWSAAACDGGTPTIFASELPPVECDDPRSVAHNNPIIFRDSDWPYGDASNSLGFTTLTVSLSTGEILGAAIEINSAQYTIVAQGPVPDGAYDLSSILTHEAGHFLGLAHSETTDAVMYAHYQPGIDGLRPDDVSAICSMYSPDGTRSTLAGDVVSMTCEPQPPAGYSTECGALDGGIVGAPTDAGGDPAPCPPVDLWTCSVGRPGARPDLSRVAAGVAIFGWLARRLAAGRRRASAAARVLVTTLALFGAGILATGQARASVSVASRLDDLVRKASAVVVATPAEQRSTWEDGRIVTYTRVRVDRRIGGPSGADAWVRTLGGAVGDVAQLAEGEATLSPGKQVLLFVRPAIGPAAGPGTDVFAVVDGAQGEFPIEATPGKPLRLGLASGIGMLLPPAAAPGSGPTRSAGEVLRGRSLDEAVGTIAASWHHLHS